MTGTCGDAADQGSLFALPSPSAPDLASYDVILANISGGKDSQAALDETVRAADAAGVRHRIVTVFCDLGDEDEWPGTRELAAEHAAHYGVRHEVVRREIATAGGRRVPQSLSEHIEARGMWPDAARRYCTSDMKRAPVHRLMTRLAGEKRAAGITRRRVRILNVLGLRAQESPGRALLAPFARDQRATNQTVRLVDQWLPVHDWDARQVWDRIASAGTRPPVTNCPPVKAQPSNAGQIAHMIQCAREGTRTGTVTLLTNIKVEFGATRRYIEFTDKGNYGIDPAAPA